jgi:hypothetical protein
MSRLRPVLVPVLVWALLSASYAQEYYPQRAGMSWTYDNGQTQTLSGPRQVRGQEVMVLTHYLEGQPVSEDYLLYTPQGVLTLGTAAGGQIFWYDPPLIVYYGERLQVGQSWQSTTRTNGLDITLRADVLGIRGVQTPAGRFNALHIRQQTLTSSGAQTLLELFFVPTVGVVRWITQDGSQYDLIEKNF